ncbi:MAG: HypC/HybG/HupF family hydrogenase formation chaperone [Chloroflexota bacterium]
MCLAIPGLVLSTSGGDLIERLGLVKFGGITKEVSLAFVPEAKVGDYVIVHVGFAISTLNEAEANRVFEYLREMDELQELEVPSEVPSSEYRVPSGV